MLPVGPPCPLPFKARVVDSIPGQLPDGVRSVLDESAPLAVRYREEVAHGHWEVPFGVVFAVPIVFLFAPMGGYQVTAHAVLEANDSVAEVGRYEATAEVSRSYGIFYGSTFHELEQEARASARRVVDREVCNDAERLAQSANRPNPSEATP
jgi:hypothetical protein